VDAKKENITKFQNAFQWMNDSHEIRKNIFVVCHKAETDWIGCEIYFSSLRFLPCSPAFFCTIRFVLGPTISTRVSLAFSS
jgi:hypothetical protein